MSATAASFGDQLDALGVWWPRGDGDALRVTATAWTDTAELLEEIARVLDTVVASVVEHHDGEAATRFATLWSQWSGPTGYLQATIADCRRLAAALDGFGTDVDVADRALLAAAEQALDELLRALTPGTVEAWTTWLHDSAGTVRDDLANRAGVRTDALAGVGNEADPSRPHAPSSAAVDPDRITWPDPGTPRDLSSLATTPVDFGAGQGLPAPATPPIVVDVPNPADSVPAGPGGGGGATVVIVGNSGTINVTVGAPVAPTPLPPTPTVPAPEPAPAATPVTAPPTHWHTFRAPPDSVPATSTSPSPSPWSPGSAAAAPDPWVPSTFDAPLPPVTAAIDALATPRPVTVPVTVHPPTTGLTTGAAVAASAAVGVAAKKATNGFFPMMPMGGGGPGGDEGPEPKRRRTYRPT